MLQPMIDAGRADKGPRPAPPPHELDDLDRWREDLMSLDPRVERPVDDLPATGRTEIVVDASSYSPPETGLELSRWREELIAFRSEFDSVTDTIRAVQDQVLQTVIQSQDAMVKAVRTWAATASGLMPGVPLPFASQVPGKPIESTLAFLDRLLTTQREFASAVLDAATPVLGDKTPDT